MNHELSIMNGKKRQGHSEYIIATLRNVHGMEKLSLSSE